MQKAINICSACSLHFSDVASSTISPHLPHIFNHHAQPPPKDRKITVLMTSPPIPLTPFMPQKEYEVEE